MIVDQNQDSKTPPRPQGSPMPAEDAEPTPAYPQQDAFDANMYPDDKPQPESAPDPQLQHARVRVLPPYPARKTVARTYSDADYARDPHKLTAYLVPFPKPTLKNVPGCEAPDRFVVYTPPAPPLTKPAEGEKEARMRKVRRKWQEEVREAKMSTAKGASWKGLKSKATRGIDWAINRTTSSNLDFLNRMGEDEKGKGKEKKDKDKDKDKDKADADENAGAGAGPDEDASVDVGAGANGLPDGAAEEGDRKAKEGAKGEAKGEAKEEAKGEANEEAKEEAKGVTELVLVYPAALQESHSPGDMRKEFVESMLRTKSKAQKDTIIASGLLPVALAIDLLATVIWPFGGLFEIDGVWAYASFRGAKVARSTTKRLEAEEEDTDGAGDEKAGDGAGAEKSGKKKAAKKEKQLKLIFTPSERVQTLAQYLAARCHERDPHMFPPAGGVPTETQVLEAIGWAPSEKEWKDWNEEQWEMAEAKGDFKQVMKKGAREWVKWCKAFEKNPKKALKK